MERVLVLITVLLAALPACNAVDDDPSLEVTALACDSYLEGLTYEGVCLLSLKALEDADELIVYSEGNVELLGGGSGIERAKEGFVVSGLSLKKGNVSRVALRFSHGAAGGASVVAPLKLPYETKGSVYCVLSGRGRIEWSTGFAAYSLGEYDNALAEEGLSSADIDSLNGLFLDLMENVSREAALPENRLYLDSVSAGETVNASVRVVNGYSDMLPYIAVALALCAALFYLYRVLARRADGRMSSSALESSVEGDEESSEIEREWENRKGAYARAMERLEGDEKALFGILFEGKGSVLQKALPEKSGFSKAKVSRVLDRLDQRGLVDRQSYGVTNKVVLKWPLERL